MDIAIRLILKVILVLRLYLCLCICFCRAHFTGYEPCYASAYSYMYTVYASDNQALQCTSDSPHRC